MSTPLPQIVHPTFELTIPSTKKRHQSRPMETRERKVLLMALEGNNPLDISNAVRSICSACISGINSEALTTFDLEWAFLQLVINSIRDTIELEVRISKQNQSCDDCSKPRLLKVDLKDAKISGEIKDAKALTIDVASGVGVKLKYPSDKDLQELEMVNQDKTEVEKLIDMISICVDVVFDNDKVFRFADYTYEDKIAWLETLPTKAMDRLEDFVNSIPQLCLDVIIECPTCKSTTTHKMSGLSDFFV